MEFDRARFDAVWRRVMPETADNSRELNAPKQTEPDEACRLREFMDSEAQDAHTYYMLAARCSGITLKRLLRIAADEQCHLKKLRAGYFILTGNMYKPPESCPLICAVPESLRRKYRDEKEGSAAYRDAAETASVNELADTYRALAEDEARHSKILGCIIENIL